MKHIALLIALAASLPAQTTYYGGRWYNLRVVGGTGVPSAETCTSSEAGTLYYRSDAKATYASWYGCNQTSNGGWTWELIGAGESYTAGAGINITDGAIIVDTAVVESRTTQQAGTSTHCASTDLTDSYTCGLTPTWTGALSSGMCVVLTVVTANDDGATLAIDGLDPVAIKTALGLDPADGAIIAGAPTSLCYNGTHFLLPTGVIARGTAALGTSEIASTACASAVTVSATGVATTDIIAWTPNADITAVTGYAPATAGGLSIYPYPTANNVNFKVCNPTSSAITPGAVTLNWSVSR